MIFWVVCLGVILKSVKLMYPQPRLQGIYLDQQTNTAHINPIAWPICNNGISHICIHKQAQQQSRQIWQALWFEEMFTVPNLNEQMNEYHEGVYNNGTPLQVCFSQNTGFSNQTYQNQSTNLSPWVLSSIFRTSTTEYPWMGKCPCLKCCPLLWSSLDD